METSTYNESYAPTREELEYLCQGLMGGAPDTDFYGPSYLTEPELANALVDYFQLTSRLAKEATSAEDLKNKLDAETTTDGMVSKLSLAKARVMNHYALGKKLARILIENKPAAAYAQDAREFLLEIAVHHHNTVQFYKNFFDFSAEECACFESFVAHTIKALYSMGYPDAAHHSSQVSRLCVVKASREGGSKSHLLQAAMVGWLHDPKFDVNLSIDNLSTHPVVASAIALYLLSTPEFKERLTVILSDDALDVDSFIQGATDALSINNDSRFVSERFIFDQVALQVSQQFEDGKGKDMRMILWDRHQQRLAAPSRGEQPELFDTELFEAISKTRLDSGMLGILKSAWAEGCDNAGLALDEAAQRALYQQIIDGEYDDGAVVRKVSDHLISRQEEFADTLKFWDVRGISLFSHHDEVSGSGRLAALALINSDPLLLSPHKILEVRPEAEVLIDRLQSYIGSLDSNINDLPKASRDSALAWQRSVFISILKGAQEMTGVDRLSRFHESHRYTPPQTDVDDLRQLILDKATWQNLSTVSVSSNAEVFEKALDVFREHYLEMCRYYREAVMSPEVNESKLV